jgi:hypothetical protein
MVTGCVLFEVRTELLNIIWTSFDGFSYYHNVFTFTLFLREGRMGVAWEPSNKMLLFLPPTENSVSHFTS